MWIKRKRRNSGQLAIFIALIFQMVFILFAMSLNVALVVHDKINLQNSVDLAAYYGAMKQAQTLNAIAHINYQIRQSWKLFAWRYRVFGNPYAARINSLDIPLDKENTPSPFHPRTGSQRVYIVCTAAYNANSNIGWGTFYLPEGSGTGNSWTPSTGQDYRFCEDIELNIPAISIPNSSSPWLQPLVTAIVQVATVGDRELRRKCQAYAYTNWLFALFSLYHFRIDHSRKAKLIYKIAEKIAGEGKEIDSKQAISSGAEQTFKNNLTYINQQSLSDANSKFETHNSLRNTRPDNWLSSESFYVYPPIYVNTHCRGNSSECSCEGTGAFATNPPQPLPPGAIPYRSIAKKLLDFSNTRTLCQDQGNDNFCDSSAGLSKVDDFIVYFGARAELQYENQIFLPFFRNQKLTLKAQAFAKPFGGRIGPKYENDKNLPLSPSSNPGEVSVQQASDESPNYAKYPGDTLGLTSHYVQRRWANNIYNANKSHKNVANYVHDEVSPLSLGPESKKWELAAIAPDLFDITYFTILPSYMETYYKHLGPDGWNFKPTRDFGGGIKQQIRTLFTLSSEFDSVKNSFYVVKNYAHLLTGWNPPKVKYKANDDRYPASIIDTSFAHCEPGAWDSDLDAGSDPTDARIGIGCVTGGRTGYSVKMIHKKHLQQIIGGTPRPTTPGWDL